MFEMAATPSFANCNLFPREPRHRGERLRHHVPTPWCTNCKSRRTMVTRRSAVVLGATRAIRAHRLARDARFDVRDVLGELRDDLEHVFPTSATATSASILSASPPAGIPDGQKKDLYSLAKRAALGASADAGAPRPRTRAPGSPSAPASAAAPSCARTPAGEPPAARSVARRKQFTVASTTAELLCCSRSSSARITSKVSVLSAGVQRNNLQNRHLRPLREVLQTVDQPVHDLFRR